MKRSCRPGGQGRRPAGATGWAGSGKTIPRLARDATRPSREAVRRAPPTHARLAATPRKTRGRPLSPVPSVVGGKILGQAGRTTDLSHVSQATIVCPTTRWHDRVGQASAWRQRGRPGAGGAAERLESVQCAATHAVDGQRNQQSAVGRGRGERLRRARGVGRAMPPASCAPLFCSGVARHRHPWAHWAVV